MISIQPKWVEKILNGEKTIEIRKTMPKCEFPIDAYIYCTKEKPYLLREIEDKNNIFLALTSRSDRHNYDTEYGMNCEYERECCDSLNGKVVAKFTLKDIDEFYVFNDGLIQYWIACDLEKGCVPYDDLANYVGRGKKGYSWHIDNLEIFDKPKELSEFYVNNAKGLSCVEIGEKMEDWLRVKKAPQSWCYCEVEQ